MAEVEELAQDQVVEGTVALAEEVNAQQSQEVAADTSALKAGSIGSAAFEAKEPSRLETRNENYENRSLYGTEAQQAAMRLAARTSSVAGAARNAEFRVQEQTQRGLEVGATLRERRRRKEEWLSALSVLRTTGRVSETIIEDAADLLSDIRQTSSATEVANVIQQLALELKNNPIHSLGVQDRTAKHEQLVNEIVDKIVGQPGLARTLRIVPQSSEALVLPQLREEIVRRSHLLAEQDFKRNPVVSVSLKRFDQITDDFFASNPSLDRQRLSGEVAQLFYQGYVSRFSKLRETRATERMHSLMNEVAVSATKRAMLSADSKSVALKSQDIQAEAAKIADRYDDVASHQVRAQAFKHYRETYSAAIETLQKGDLVQQEKRLWKELEDVARVRARADVAAAKPIDANAVVAEIYEIREKYKHIHSFIQVKNQSFESKLHTLYEEAYKSEHATQSLKHAESQEAALMRQVRSAAMRLARSDFDRDHSSQLNESAAEKELRKICARYPALDTYSIRHRISNEFKHAYSSRRDLLYRTELSWAQRKWHAVKSWFSSAKKFLSNFGKRVAENVKWLNENRADIWKGIKRSTAELLCRENRQWLVEKALSLQKPETWVSIGKTAVKAGVWLKDAGLQLVSSIVSDPKAALREIGGFLSEVCKELGLTDMFYNSSRALLAGNFSEAGRLFLKGSGRLFLDACGLRDIGLAIKCYVDGDFTQAAIHLGFGLWSFTSVALTFVFPVGGAAMLGVGWTARTLLKRGFSKLAKEGCEHFARYFAYRVERNFMRAVGSQQVRNALSKLGKRAADDVLGEFAEKVSRDGAKVATTEVIEKISVEVGEKAGKEFMQMPLKRHALAKSFKLQDFIELEAREMLLSASKRGGKAEIKKALNLLGVKGAARKKALAKALQRGIKNGSFDKEFKQLLTDELTSRFSYMIASGMEASFKKRLRKGLQGKLSSKAGKSMSAALKKHSIKFTKQEVDDLVEFAFRGLHRGIAQGIRPIIARAIRRAFRRLRRGRWRRLWRLLGLRAGATRSRTRRKAIKFGEKSTAAKPGSFREHKPAAAAAHKVNDFQNRTFTKTVARDGKTFLEKYHVGEDGKRVLIDSTEIGDLSRGAQNNATSLGTGSP